MRDPTNVEPEAGLPAAGYSRRDLRIAIRQLERAELYVAAVLSLDLGDERAEESAEALIENVRELRRYLSARRATA